jgi:hypothetical protein
MVLTNHEDLENPLLDGTERRLRAGWRLLPGDRKL